MEIEKEKERDMRASEREIWKKERKNIWLFINKVYYYFFLKKKKNERERERDMKTERKKKKKPKYNCVYLFFFFFLRRKTNWQTIEIKKNEKK